MANLQWQANLEAFFRSLLGQYLLDRTESFFNQLYRPAVHSESHLAVIDTHLMQNGGLKIADVVLVLNGVITGIIGRAVDDSCLDSASPATR
jgi:hypothetical protein